MACRRMINSKITDDDRFLVLAPDTQALYMHLVLHADDDGFVSNPLGIVRLTGCQPESLEELKQSGFVIPFISGVLCTTGSAKTGTPRVSTRRNAMLQSYGIGATPYWMIVNLTSAIRAAALTAILASLGTAWMTAMGKPRGMTDRMTIGSPVTAKRPEKILERRRDKPIQPGSASFDIPVGIPTEATG